ncbi:MAG: hypothetical protein ACSLE6_19885 [Mycobacterium sp.]
MAESGTGAGPKERPVDVDTGFWLWVTAVPLLVIGYITDVAVQPRPPAAVVVYTVTGFVVVLIIAVVITFMLLMRQGYRWCRTVLTGGGAAAVVFVIVSVFSVDRPPVPAAVCAFTGIVGAVLVAGGGYLLHRKDAHAYFTR